MVLDWISGYKIPFHINPFQSSAPSERHLAPADLADLRREIFNLRELGAISECSPVPDQFLSRYFLVDKSNGGKRFILNVKSLNRFILTEHFKMEDLRTAVKLLSPGCFLAKIDLKNAYFLIPIAESDKKFLRFSFQNSIFEFNCLPFGLCSAPCVFTKVLKPVLASLRARGFLSCIYLNDILCICSSFDICERNVEESTRTLQNLGFIINSEKSSLHPEKSCQFLGFVLHSDPLRIELPEAKKHKIVSLIYQLSRKEVFSIRFFAKVIGLLVSICPAVTYGVFYTKRLERQKYLALRRNRDDFDASMQNNEVIRSDLQWWRLNIPRASNPIRQGSYVLEIFSDASTSGWGAFCRGRRTHGFWEDSERAEHINCLELRAAFLALQFFAGSLNNCEILLRLDNTTAIAYINKGGSTRFSHLNVLARNFWRWCEARKIWVVASYIPSRENVEADRESRRAETEIEWELSDQAFLQISEAWGAPTIDLFASRSNAKCRKFVSWHRDPVAWSIDAFTFSWTGLFFYAFPPFSLLLKTLNKILRDKATGIVVAPFWQAQPWFPLFSDMIVEGKVMVFDPDSNLLSSPSSLRHPLHKSLRLMAAVLSGVRPGAGTNQAQHQARESKTSGS